MSDKIVPTTAGAIVREGFDSTSMELSGSTAVEALAARQQAMIQARWLMALKKPRHLPDVRARMIASTASYHFADAAIYELPRGGQMVSGPSIRLMEAFARTMGNILTETMVVHDDESKRILEVTTTDLETVDTYSSQVVVEKIVERKSSDGRDVIRERKNARGDTLYLCRANPDEVNERQANLVSKAIRTNVKRLVDAGILEEVMQACEVTIANKMKEDPAAEAKKICDAFAKIGVLPSQLEELLQFNPLAKPTPEQATKLRGVYAAITSGETTWAKMVAESKAASGDGVKAPPAPAKAAPKAKAEKATPATPAAQQQTQPAATPAAAPVAEAPAHDPVTGEVHEQPPDDEPINPGKGNTQAFDQYVIAKMERAKTRAEVEAAAELSRDCTAQGKIDVNFVFARRMRELP